ncbi:hypothetical protein OsI_23686 [Oryza sativa Indica Group]|nr:hypothetical protein OsI_23686 [Oryza sativa Indica Group]
MVREPQDLRLGERDLLEEMSMNEEVEAWRSSFVLVRSYITITFRGFRPPRLARLIRSPSSPCSKTCRLITPESIIATISHRSTMNGIELSSEDKAILVETLKNKLQALAEQHVDVLESLAPSVRKRVDVLMEIQSQHDELEVKFFEEKAALEAKYQKLYGPLYSKEKGVPDFWLNAMKNNEILAEELAHVARSTLRDKIIPHAVSWFTREAVQDEDYGASWVDDEEEDDNDDEYSDEEA